METKAKLGIVAVVLVAVIVGGYFALPYLRLLSGYGLPSPAVETVTFPYMTNTNTVMTTSTFRSSYVNWVYLSKTYNYTYRIYSSFGQLESLRLYATVALTVKVELSELASPRDITDQAVIFKTGSDKNYTYYNNVTYHAYSYSFKINTAWDGQINFVQRNSADYFNNAEFPTGKTSMAKNCVKALIAMINNDVYATKTRILLSLDAPTLARESTVAYGYCGLLGAWLQDYKLSGWTQGTADDLQPQGTGTIITLYLDEGLTKLAWHVASPPQPNQKFNNTLVAYPDYYATPYAYFYTDIITMGSTITFNDAGTYPNYWMWSGAVGNTMPNSWSTLPACAQWIRADILLTSSQPYQVPNYQAPPEETKKQVVTIPAEPTNLGTTSPPPSSQPGLVLSPGTWIIIAVVIISVVIIVYAILKTREK
jgi:hypothetical protein